MASLLKNLDVLLLQPPSPPFMDVDREFEAGFGLAHATARSTWGHSGQPFFNHALAWTAGVLQAAGYRVGFADGQAERWTLSETIRQVSEASPSVLVTLVNIPSLSKDLELIEQIKRSLTGTVSVACGVTCRTFTDLVLGSAGVDVAVCGEPEIVVPGLVRSVKEGHPLSDVAGIAFRENGQVHRTEAGELPKDLDFLPAIPYHMLPMERYRGKYFAKGLPIAPIISSKGCSFKCGYYCPYPLGYGGRVRFRSPEKVVDEIELLKKDYGISHFIFRDQNFTIWESHAEGLCRLLVERKLDIHWVCETRLVLVKNAELLKLMRAAGCEQINFGLENGDPQVFEAVGKPGTSFEQIKRAVELTREAGIRAHAHVIVGLPGESWRTVWNTARLLRSYRFNSVNFGFLCPYPGTGFYDEAKAKGHILTEDWSKYTHTEPVVRTDAMSAFELKLAQLLLSNSFGGFKLHRNAARKAVRGVKRLLSGAGAGAGRTSVGETSGRS